MKTTITDISKEAGTVGIDFALEGGWWRQSFKVADLQDLYDRLIKLGLIHGTPSPIIALPSTPTYYVRKTCALGQGSFITLDSDGEIYVNFMRLTCRCDDRGLPFVEKMKPK